MIDNYLWEELATFAEQKTLAKTADALHVTQPTITRGMQKLEDELEVKLFNRQPNRISLTKTGKLAAKEAIKIISLNQQAIEKITNLAKSQQITSIAFTVPGPRILLNHINKKFDQNIQIEQKLQETNISQLLNNGQFNLIFSNQEILTADIESRFIGIEQLSVDLNKFMYQANQSSVTFNDLKGLSFLVLADIGPWKDIIQQEIPETKFLYQDQEDTFSEISKYSDFPFFSSNLSQLNPNFKLRDQPNNNRIPIPISDDNAKMEIYANYLKSNRRSLKEIIELVINNWP